MANKKSIAGKRGRALAVLGLSFATAAVNAQSGVNVTIDGQPVRFDGAGPQMVDGRVLVPLRGIFEKLGVYVQWNESQHSIFASRGSDTVRLQIGNTQATVDGRTVNLDVPAQIIDGSTMVPIRFVSESVGAEVHWDDAQQRVVIVSSQPISQTPPPPPPAPHDPTPPANTNPGPVRMARFSLVEGGVTWRPSDALDWSEATTNLPLRQDAEIWTDGGSRAEIQFDDGSLLRLGGGAIATLHTMYSDDEGEFTEIRLNTGTATLRLTSRLSKYQIDTPLAALVSSGPADFRIDDSNGLRVVVRGGQVRAQGNEGQLTLASGEYLHLNDARSAYAVAPAPGEDEWDRFCDSRDNAFARPSRYLPANIGLVAGNLDSFGTWVNVAPYGYCWRPAVSDPNWAPYRNGRWVWVEPFGWTWCGVEPWGWAPYHYGSWARTGQGWVWCPGPAQQYWSPAVVHFSTYDGNVAWSPLAPSELKYPSALGLSLRSGNWALHFSIGGAASYYPAGPSYCAPRPWANTVVNRTTNVYNVTHVTNITNVKQVFVTNTFVPANSRVQGGATVARVDSFAGRENFGRSTVSPSVIFTRGQAYAAPKAASVSFAGPTNVRPTTASFTPQRVFLEARPSSELLNRPVVRLELPKRIANSTRPMPNVRPIPRGVDPRNPLGHPLPRDPRASAPGTPSRPPAPAKPLNPGGRPESQPPTAAMDHMRSSKPVPQHGPSKPAHVTPVAKTDVTPKAANNAPPKPTRRSGSKKKKGFHKNPQSGQQ